MQRFVVQRPGTTEDKSGGVKLALLRLLIGGELCHADGWLDDPFPVVAEIIGRAALRRDVLSHLNRRQHLDGVPRANG